MPYNILKGNDIMSRMAARRGAELSLQNNGLGCPTSPQGPAENIAENPRLSNRENGSANENPGALAGATGAELHSSAFTDEFTLKRLRSATALAHAAAACEPDDRVPLLERLLDELRPGWPQVPFLCGVMEEAAFWADMASRVELKAYCLATFQRMKSSDQAAFLDYVQGRAAA